MEKGEWRMQNGELKIEKLSNGECRMEN